jgi:hypothetical protein
VAEQQWWRWNINAHHDAAAAQVEGGVAPKAQETAHHLQQQWL